MKKRAFTMVELIFVIVILGILAAVAVPKLNASRADAKTAALKAKLVTVAKDLETYYAANGAFYLQECTQNYCNAKLTDITNVAFDEITASKTDGFFKIAGKNCVKVYAGRYKDYHDWVFDVINNQECLDELKKPEYKDVRWLFTGYTVRDAAAVPPAFAYKGSEKDVIENMAGAEMDAIHVMNANGGVKW